MPTANKRCQEKNKKERERENIIRHKDKRQIRSMASREHKRAALNEKLQQLRAATNSSAVITIYQLIYT